MSDLSHLFKVGQKVKVLIDDFDAPKHFDDGADVCFSGCRDIKNVIHTKNGIKTFTNEELIDNALDQEKQGVKPMFSWYDYKKNEFITPAGWLVVSTFEDGAIVVYRRNDGKMIINRGWQSDFACNMEV